MPYDIGDSVPIAWDVKDSTGTLANAATATLTITLPDGTTVTPAVTNPPASTGHYQVTYVPAVEGRYTWRALMTGPNAAYGDTIDVREAASPSLISLADAKDQLNITSTKSDEQLRGFLEATTSIVESYVGPVVRRQYTRRVHGYRPQIPLPHTQVLSIDNIVVVLPGTGTVDLTQILLDTPSGIFGFKSSFMVLYGDMDVTYTVGRTSVKAAWILAAQIIIQHLWESRLGNLPSAQGDDPVDPRLGTGYLVPFRAITLLQPDQAAAGFA
jgi:hypothetical protein